MSDEPPSPPAPQTPDDPDQHDPDHLLDPVDAYRLLRANEGTRDALIERYGIVGAAELDIAAELSDGRVLADADGFPTAFRSALRSIEVLDRNGARQPSLPRLGPLKPLADVIVSLVARWVVRGHQSKLIGDISRLVSRREAVAAEGSAELRMLRSARFHAARVEQGYRSNPLGVPAFVLGGAAISAVTAGLEGLILSAFNSKVVGSVFAATLSLMLLGLSWCALRAAGVARRRIRMSTDRAMAELWTTIGSCGRPPRDQSFVFAIVAIVLSAVSALAAPVLVYLVVGL